MPDDPKNWPLSGVNLAATIIRCYSCGTNVGSASGFFFRHKGRKFLTTNRHVVLDEQDKYRPDRLEIILHIDYSAPQKNAIVNIPLYAADSPVWLEHPRFMELECDVVLVPLPDDQIAPAKMNFLSIKNIPGDDINISAFSDVIVVGYPRGFHDEENNLPIYRQGMMASAYPFGFENKPCFLIDANLHGGTSGSMVLNSTHNLLIRKDSGAGFHTTHTWLLGVFSDEYVISGDPLGLNTVWYSYLLPQIAEMGIPQGAQPSHKPAGPKKRPPGYGRRYAFAN